MHGSIAGLIALALWFASSVMPFGHAAAEQCPPHPYPCGDEWPDGLEGPFALKGGEPLYVRVPVPADWSDPDGPKIELEGWIGVPDLPPGVGAPVVLVSTPYNSDTVVSLYSLSAKNSPASKFWWEEPGDWDPRMPWGGVSPLDLVRRGYAAAYFSVRGTSDSGGCMEFFGPNEQKDQGFLVDWLAAQPWTNGRVAMGGVSALAGTAMEAAITAGHGLKTIIISGVVSDLYTIYGTPQGAIRTTYPADLSFKATEVSLLPSTGFLLPYADWPDAGETQHATTGWVPLVPERACPELVRTAIAPHTAHATDVRDAEYFNARRLIDRLPDSTAAVLLAHGFLESAAHSFQESALWHALRGAPKRQIEGLWGHQFPTNSDTHVAPASPQLLDPAWEKSTWHDVLFNWIDYWLKGQGAPEHLGVVDYQDRAGTWHQSNAWPPSEARDEVQYLSGGAMSRVTGDASRSFRSAPDPRNSFKNSRATCSMLGGQVGCTPAQYKPWAALCDDTATSGVSYKTDPAREPVTIAGNPFAYLRLQADQPGGIVSLDLLDLSPEFACNDKGEPTGLLELASGAADLRFHSGNFTGTDFPVGVPKSVRIELMDFAHVLPAGHRLALVVGYGDGVVGWTSLQPYFPTVTVLAGHDSLASHVVLPVVDGTLGGSPPTVAYPPRPFVPAG